MTIEQAKSELMQIYGALSSNKQIAIDTLVKASVKPQEPKSEWEHDHELLKAYSDGTNEALDKVRAEIIKYEGDCRLSVDEYPSCKECTDNVFETIYGILDKFKAEGEEKDGECK